LRRSFASMANDLGFTTIAVLTSAIVGCVAPDHFPAHYRGASMNLFERRIQAMLAVN
jgi:Na+-translocating ferredoxin:NAD+ oxidoreductase RnfA subunit